uniref:NADH dehydrogenase subunit 4L n=1 Tax=Megalophaedusa stenospira TaxID=1885772 RepID=A0A224A0B4_9EUPU|nr:NADH dehydrogenase subunit 4L [Megalophaedusa stenospira]
MSLLSFLFFLMLVVMSLIFNTKQQFLVALLLLETLVLISLVLSLLLFSLGESSLFLFILLLTLAVCEAALALGLLVSYIKLNGSDLISGFPSL